MGLTSARYRWFCFATQIGAALLALLVIGGCAVPPVAPNGAGVPLELAEIRASTISDIHYRFNLKIPEHIVEPVSGTVELSFSWNDPLAHDLVLDLMSPESRVQGLTVNGEPAAPQLINDHVVVPAETLSPGQNRLELVFDAGDEALNRSDELLFTLFVPDRAHFSLPVFDQPNLKARYSLTLQVPEGWTAVANGPLLEETNGSEGIGRVLRFAETEPLPTYLFAFVAGKLQVEQEERDGRTLRMIHRETDADKLARNRDELFALHFAALDWLEEYTAIPYPFQKLDFVLIPAFQYGGMEHAGAIFYRDRRLLLDESATQNDYLGRASLIAHETAHMWFGDLVTMDWFDDVWLKEVFASFMAAKIIEPSYPDVNHDLRFLLDHHPDAYSVDRTAGANPIRQPLENLNEAGSLYGAIIYNKAPIMMRQLELAVGEEPFRDGVREYLESYRFGNATWNDLVAILDRRLPETLAEWSRVWVDQPGRPIIAAKLSLAGEQIEQLELTQEDPSGDGRVWPQTVSVAIGYGDTTVARIVELTGPSVMLADIGELTRPDFVLPDGSGLGYACFRLDPASRSYLLEHLPALDDATVRGAGWVSLWDAALEQEVAPDQLLDLYLRGLEQEDDEQNLQLVIAYLETTFWRLLSSAAREQQATQVEQVLWQQLQQAETATLTGALFRAYREMALTTSGVSRLVQVWHGQLKIPGLVLSEDERTDLAFALAVRQVDGWEEILDAQGDQIENPDRKQRFEFIRPALDADPGVRESFFASLSNVDNRAREPWVLTALRYLHHPLRAGHSVQFLTPGLELLEEIQRTGDIFFPKGWLDVSFRGHSSTEAASAVQAFLDAHPAYPKRLRGKILQSADMLMRAAEITGS
jgi:aminopeptidase N